MSVLLQRGFFVTGFVVRISGANSVAIGVAKSLKKSYFDQRPALSLVCDNLGRYSEASRDGHGAVSTLGQLTNPSSQFRHITLLHGQNQLLLMWGARARTLDGSGARVPVRACRVP